MLNFCRAGDSLDHMICPLLVCLESCIEVILEKKQLQYAKHHHKFDQNDFPQGSPKRHTTKTISVKPVDLFWIFPNHLPHTEMEKILNFT